MSTITHTEDCGCVHEQVDVPDDQWIGQGWALTNPCPEHRQPELTPSHYDRSMSELDAGL